MKPHKVTYFISALVLVLCSLPLFYNLAEPSVRLWDEAIFGVNALEMEESNNPIVTYYDGEPDLYNNKPPLQVWSQLIFMKIVGHGELALRLPSALAGLLAVVMLLVFSQRIIQEASLGWTAALVLVTSTGFMSFHVTRSGEADALLAMWITGYSLTFFTWLEKESASQIRYAFVMAVFLALAILTKGVAALFPFPALVVYAIIRRKLRWALRNRYLYWSCGSALAVGVAYYLLREALIPGYLAANMGQQWSGFITQTDGHTGEFFFYINKFIDHRYLPWIYLLPVGLVVPFTRATPWVRKLAVFCSVFTAWYLLFLSCAATKISWYDAPMYPVMALLIGCIFSTGITYLSKSTTRIPVREIAIALVIILILIMPYRQTLTRLGNHVEYSVLGTFMRKAHNKFPSLGEFTVVKRIWTKYHKADVLFYQKAWKRATGANIRITQQCDFQNKEVVAVCESQYMDTIRDKYEYSILQESDSCKLVLIANRYSKTPIPLRRDNGNR